MKKIIVLGTGCSRCKALYDTVLKAVEELALDATVEKQEDIVKIMEYNVMRLPGLVIDGKVVSSGKKLTIDEVKKLLNQ